MKSIPLYNLIVIFDDDERKISPFPLTAEQADIERKHFKGSVIATPLPLRWNWIGETVNDSCSS
jgi:hypothetical protein